jgi:flavin-dependent dehydrogenase
VDVAILGGGLGGNLLARQLRREAPELSVGLYEKATERSYKVGESTVEIAADYLIRRHGLSNYLYEEHLPKNGLRFFFDTPERNTKLEEMSEIGPIAFPFRQSFQIDRARLEADLLRMNDEAGVLVEQGVQARKLELGEDGAPHRFELHGPEGKRDMQARWLIDATGRASLIAKQKDLRVAEESHTMASAWGRFEGVVDIDNHPDQNFLKRVNYTARRLSTIHFCYPGYWIWFIPLRGGLTSVGWVGDREIWDREIKTLAGFRPFLESHRAVGDLLRDAKQIDEGALKQLAFSSKQVYSTDRWALLGESGVFNDPFYSPGSDFIALGCDFVCDLITRDKAGESKESLAERLALYDEFIRFRHESTLRIHRDLYSTLGSFEVFKLRYSLDLSIYYNLWTASFMRNEHLNSFWLRKQLHQRDVTFKAQENFAALFHTLEAQLRESGEFYGGNLGRFATGLEHIGFIPEVGQPRSNTAVLERTNDIFNGARDRALDLLGEPADSPRRGRRELPFFAGDESIL